MNNKLHLCVTLIVLGKRAHEAGDQKGVDNYASAMRDVVRLHGITKDDIDLAMLRAQEQYHQKKPTATYESKSTKETVHTKPTVRSMKILTPTQYIFIPKRKSA